MKTATVRAGDITYDVFCHQVEDGQKADLIDGVIYMPSPDNIDANNLCMWMGGIFYGFASRRKIGQVFGFRVACRLDDRNAPEPDILFVANANLERVKRGGIEGPPDLAIEIVSPESVERDYKKKRKQYAKFGVPEYWIVDEMEQRVLQLRLDEQGKYREVRQRKGIIRSEIMPGFWLRSEWLWQRPLPDSLDTLLSILG